MNSVTQQPASASSDSLDYIGWTMWKRGTPCNDLDGREHRIVCDGQEEEDEEDEATTVTSKVANQLLSAASRWQLQDPGLQCRNLPSIWPTHTHVCVCKKLHWHEQRRFILATKAEARERVL